MGFAGGIQKAIESRRAEREHQHIICGTNQSDDPAERIEIDKAHMGDSAVHVRAFRTSVLVVSILSFFSLPRELADENRRADSTQGETEVERI